MKVIQRPYIKYESHTMTIHKTWKLHNDHIWKNFSHKKTVKCFFPKK